MNSENLKFPTEELNRTDLIMTGKNVFGNYGFYKQYLQSVLTVAMLVCMANATFAQQQDMIIRISEIEVHPQYLEAYKAILKYEAEASVRLEKGVIAIFPMFQKKNPT